MVRSRPVESGLRHEPIQQVANGRFQNCCFAMVTRTSKSSSLESTQDFGFTDVASESTANLTLIRFPISFAYETSATEKFAERTRIKMPQRSQSIKHRKQCEGLRLPIQLAAQSIRSSLVRRQRPRGFSRDNLFVTSMSWVLGESSIPQLASKVEAVMSSIH